eukprot:scaffold312_cov145-Skeletonema_menzelii.AAC.12
MHCCKFAAEFIGGGGGGQTHRASVICMYLVCKREKKEHCATTLYLPINRTKLVKSECASFGIRLPTILLMLRFKLPCLHRYLKGTVLPEPQTL